MKKNALRILFLLSVLALSSSRAAEVKLRVQAGQLKAHPIPKYITGKFAEHLGNNIYNGMDAQILRNPSFADFPFSTGQTTPDGIVTFHFERSQIRQEMSRRGGRMGWPEEELDGLFQAYEDGLAGWWTRVGQRNRVVVSPDTGKHGGRAQRIEVKTKGEGIAQWAYLPLHRTRKYEFSIFVRLVDAAGLVIGLGGNEKTFSSGEVSLTPGEWQWVNGVLQLGDEVSADQPIRFSITATGPGQFVISRALLRPADHVSGFDPDVVRFLKESKLPILRWPGGNFVSGYHWEDGIGPMERRPNRPNYAWGGVEPNFFGTDEFVRFCREVGCEPMICVNAGDGTADEAARWIEYCNGDATAPMGRLRAANGHREPYGIKHWEVGNELWGRWQVHWTTARGYSDRYLEFVNAMNAADPAIELYACGAPVFWGRDWNRTLVERTASKLRTTTDHPLIGGDLSPDAAPLDVFRDFMAVPFVLEARWKELESWMLAAGVEAPRLAVTELQMFAHLQGGSSGAASPKLTHSTLVSPATLGEGLYNVLVYHAAIRLAPFVSMITHSATVNHGGGLRKERERVYANPCHYAQTMFGAFAGARPVEVDLQAPRVNAPMVLPELRNATNGVNHFLADALAAVAEDGSLLVSLVHCGAEEPLKVSLEIEGFSGGREAEWVVLGSDVPWAVNSLANPEAVVPRTNRVSAANKRLEFELPAYALGRLRVAPEKGR